MTGPCDCGEDRPAAMTHRGCCYECAARADGRPGTEAHHVWGRALSPASVVIPGNLHRDLSERQRRRDEALRRPGDDPLHLCAAVLMTIAEIAEAVGDHARRASSSPWIADLARILADGARHAADWLLCLAARLAEEHGPGWATVLDLPPLRLP